MIGRRTIPLAVAFLSIIAAVAVAETDPPAARLCRAAYGGNQAEVASLLAQGADVNGTCYNFQFWRGVELRHGDLRCLDCSLKRCPSPLVLAVKSCHDETVAFLLQRGASVKSDDGRVAFYYASHLSTGTYGLYHPTDEERRAATRIVGLLESAGAISVLSSIAK